MPTFDSHFSAARADLASWCRPIVADLINELYVRALKPDSADARALAPIHERFWNSLLLGEASAATHRAFLEARASSLCKVVDRIDEAVVNEMLDVITQRFARSPAQARTFCHVVMAAAMELGATRARREAKPTAPVAPASRAASAAAETAAA